MGQERYGSIEHLGISTFEEPFYSEVVRACGLDADIEIFPRGHGSLSDSLTLSEYLLSYSNTCWQCWNISERRTETETSTCSSGLRKKGAHHTGRCILGPRRRYFILCPSPCPRKLYLCVCRNRGTHIHRSTWKRRPTSTHGHHGTSGNSCCLEIELR